MKAKVLSEVYDIFDPQEALSGDKLREYYVKRESPVKSLADILSSEKPLKYLFVGSRGNGKSTELNRLSELVNDKLFVVSFSIKDKLNLFDVDYALLLRFTRAYLTN
jgi:signal recognition particle GTPase